MSRTSCSTHIHTYKMPEESISLLAQRLWKTGMTTTNKQFKFVKHFGVVQDPSKPGNYLLIDATNNAIDLSNGDPVNILEKSFVLYIQIPRKTLGIGYVEHARVKPLFVMLFL